MKKKKNNLIYYLSWKIKDAIILAGKEDTGSIPAPKYISNVIYNYIF